MLNGLHGIGLHHVQHDSLAGIQLCGKLRKPMCNIAAPGDGDPKALYSSITHFIDLAHLVQLQHNAVGIFEKFPSLVCWNHALGAADKNGKAQGFLQFPDGFAQVRLRHIEIFCRFGDGTGLLHFNGVFKK